MSDEERALWRRFAGGDLQARERLIERHLRYAKIKARQVWATMPPHVTLDECIEFAILGLIDAVDKFDASRAQAFESYAAVRIRGAIFDAMRREEWTPRSLRPRLKAAERALETLTARLKRHPTHEEWADAAGMSPHELSLLLADEQRLWVEPLQIVPTGDEAPLDSWLADHAQPYDEPSDGRGVIAEAIAALDDRHRHTIAMTYLSGMTQADIADELGVTKKSAYQRQRSAILALRRAVARTLTGA